MTIKKLLTTAVLFVLCIVSFLSPALIQAQSAKPIIVLSPSTTVAVGVTNPIQVFLVNMGIPLRRLEITVRLSGDFDQKQGFSFKKMDTMQYGLAYKSHYASPFAGRSDTQDLTMVFEATEPQGYNQGSAQIPLVEVSYLPVQGNFAAFIVPEKTKVTDANGNLLPSIQTYGAYNYKAETGTTSVNNGLDGYSLSFESDPVRKWWPTAPNSVQQIDAAIWKDSDGDNVKKFTDVWAEWQIDSNYLEITNTSSSYFDKCPVPTVSERPCIRFVAHVITKMPGKTGITLRVNDPVTNTQTWNQYPLEIYALNQPSSTPVMTATSVPVVKPQPTFIPKKQVTDKEFEEVQQRVTYLQSQVDQQQRELKETQSVLSRVVRFLKGLFGF
ncbi:hypothetical protein KBD71_00340 [Candidatus Woesebacteria bacterium]|nr:hypothetical protein [Candidatus Woesebacteria bacterium]